MAGECRHQVLFLASGAIPARGGSPPPSRAPILQRLVASAGLLGDDPDAADPLRRERAPLDAGVPPGRRAPMPRGALTDRQELPHPPPLLSRRCPPLSPRSRPTRPL